MVSRRLDTEERRAIRSGCVYVWEERGSNTEATGLGIERWTDSIRWGPSRVREEFLYYQEKGRAPTDGDPGSDSDSAGSQLHLNRSPTSLRGNLIKQTYSVFVETPHGRRKWHLIAYFTEESKHYLRTIEAFPELASIGTPPPGKYRSARVVKSRTSQSSGSLLPVSGKVLAPLEYLQTIPPTRRHPVDELALMALTAARP